MAITSAKKNEQIQIKWQFHLPQWLITSATYELSGQNLPPIKMGNIICQIVSKVISDLTSVTP